jgi:hypothetical protein
MSAPNNPKLAEFSRFVLPLGPGDEATVIIHGPITKRKIRRVIEFLQLGEEFYPDEAADAMLSAREGK